MKIKQSLFAVILAVSANGAVQAVPATVPTVIIQGSSNAHAVWRAPRDGLYNTFVYIPGNSGTTQSAYQYARSEYYIYPKGKNPNSADCLATDANYPCIISGVYLSLFKNRWVQLSTALPFIGGKGYITVSSNALHSTVKLGVAGMRFEPVTPEVALMQSKWSKVLGSISALKLAIGECLNDTSGNYTLCDSTSLSELGKYGGTLPIIENAIVTLVANTAAIQIAGDSQLAGCTFQFQATIDSAAGVTSWQPKATAAVAPSSDVAECAQYVKNAIY